jgi:hypothetical protein
MSVTYATAVKTARMNADATYFYNGTLEIVDVGGTNVIAIFTLNGTAGSVAGNVWTLGFTSGTVSAALAGTAATARVKNSGGTVGISGLTVGTSATDIILNNTSITSGQSITLTSATITHA